MKIKEVIETELGQPLDEVYSEFEEEPLTHTACYTYICFPCFSRAIYCTTHNRNFYWFMNSL